MVVVVVVVVEVLVEVEVLVDVLVLVLVEVEVLVDVLVLVLVEVLVELVVVVVLPLAHAHPANISSRLHSSPSWVFSHLRPSSTSNEDLPLKPSFTVRGST